MFKRIGKAVVAFFYWLSGAEDAERQSKIDARFEAIYRGIGKMRDALTTPAEEEAMDRNLLETPPDFKIWAKGDAAVASAYRALTKSAYWSLTKPRTWQCCECGRRGIINDFTCPRCGGKKGLRC